MSTLALTPTMEVVIAMETESVAVMIKSTVNVK